MSEAGLDQAAPGSHFCVPSPTLGGSLPTETSAPEHLRWGTDMTLFSTYYLLPQDRKPGRLGSLPGYKLVFISSCALTQTLQKVFKRLSWSLPSTPADPQQGDFISQVALGEKDKN